MAKVVEHDLFEWQENHAFKKCVHYLGINIQEKRLSPRLSSPSTLFWNSLFPSPHFHSEFDHRLDSSNRFAVKERLLIKVQPEKQNQK